MAVETRRSRAVASPTANGNGVAGKRRSSRRSVSKSPSPPPRARKAAPKKGTPRKADPSKKGAKSKDVTSLWSETAGTGVENGSAFRALGAILLLLSTPPFTIAMWSIFVQFEGSVVAFVTKLSDPSEWPAFIEGLPTLSWEGTRYVAVFGAFQAALQVLVPGAEFVGPISPMGNRPVYKANGVQCFLITLVAFFAAWHFGVFEPARVYDQFGEMLNFLNIFGNVLCLFLTIKGYVAPSSTDSGSTGSFLFDYFWGTELYPRLLGGRFDIKQWTNCRMGLMAWSVLPLCFMAKQMEASETGQPANSMLVCVFLMNVYVFKFFLWETGYFNTMDIAHDRAGFYICWGCLVWIPSVYCSPPLHLVHHPTELSLPVALGMVALGLASIYINWAADEQKKAFRSSGGKAQVWGKEPRFIRAKYATKEGGVKTSLLLLSGWWGLARHFHYVPEITASFFWTAPALFTYIMPYFYVIFLTILLTDRAFRDDARCASKYGKYWDEYKKHVPYKIVPFLV